MYLGKLGKLGRKIKSMFWSLNKDIDFFSHSVGLFCVLLGQSADRCPIFVLLVIETDKFVKPNTQLAHFWTTGGNEKKADKDIWSIAAISYPFQTITHCQNFISELIGVWGENCKRFNFPKKKN